MTAREDVLAGNPLIAIQRIGQSIWYDNISRGLITSGALRAMIENDGLLGVTSNPAIFQKAVGGSADYDDAIAALVSRGVPSAGDIYEALAVEDIRMACDVLRPVYQSTDGRDGYVSLEVSPYLANDTQATVTEGRRLHAAVARPNVMIKVPGTRAGIPAIEELTGSGLSINVTLLFGLEAYEAAAHAYIAGLERAHGRGLDVSRIASVASFFVSRIDTLVDERLKHEIDRTGDAGRRQSLETMLGKAAIANAKTAYALYQDIVSGERWQALAQKGARTQRVLWASTSTKNPAYPKAMYVDELIAPDTVNTVPAETFDEYRAHGKPRPALIENWDEQLAEARAMLDALRTRAGIDIHEVAETLVREGITKFADPFDQLLATIEKKREAVLGSRFASQSIVPADMETAWRAAMEEWRKEGRVRRLWAGDASLWSGADEARWLGWLTLTGENEPDTGMLSRLADEMRTESIPHAVLLGMGGSSLAPDVIRRTLGRREGFPELLVCDSTVPGQVKAIAEAIDPATSLFIVSSKSGSTVEPNVMKKFFFALAGSASGASGAAGRRFVAVTDPGSSLEGVARADGFRYIAPGLPSVGGRYSALSHFGMLPAAVSGDDVSSFLARADLMVDACGALVPPDANPGVALGLFIGTSAKQGRDKLTFIMSPGLSALGVWLEQLIAESTGKIGRGIVPVDGETVAPPERYGKDRVFVYTRLASDATAGLDRAVAALEKAGHPVTRIVVNDAADLGAEFFRWEIATAVAGSVLGINPFDQPDVESAKVAARKLMEVIAASGSLPPETPLFTDSGLAFFADPALAETLGKAARKSAAGALRAHLARIEPGDYFAVQAYVEMSPANERALQSLRHAVRDARAVATTVGFGPRFLHSTGQLHKGGPNTGLFLQITCDDATDLAIPGERATFGALKAAQARGDFEVLVERGRRILRVHMGKNVSPALTDLAAIVSEAMR